MLIIGMLYSTPSSNVSITTSELRMSDKKRELKREYKLNHRPMGVYQIRNVVNEKVLIGAALDLPGIFNRHRFQLKMGNHPNTALQAEWNEFGDENFAFEI